MRSVLPSPLLRGAFVLDAVVSAAAGVLQLAPGARMVAWLGLPAPLLTETGVFLLAYAGALLLLARSRTLWAPLVQAVVLGNAGWALGCVLALLLGWLAPTALGTAWLLLQAVAVLAFAAAEGLGLARSAPAPAAVGLARS
ncbi:hypothetical protein AACH10_14905 [Ideonella sp. DXS22W]|uniref:Integral membrane protein n=1 Tax=Pseudaquabacterium inlustre TaxID=2984192 RepID=A0ABU9CI54_9BURK